MPATTPPHSQSGAAAPGGAEPAHDEGARLQALAHYAILDTPAEAAFDEIAALAAVLCQAPTALVGFVAEDRQWFKARVGLALQETPRCEAICHTTIQQPEPLFVVPDTTQDPRFAGLPLARAPDGFRFYAGALLRTPAGLVVGTLCVLDRQPRSLTPAQATGLQTLARQVMAQMELRRQRSQVQQARAGREAELANQRLLQAALMKGEQRLARLAAQVPGVVFQFQMRPDGSTCFPYASDGLHALFGVGPDQVVDDATPAISRVLPEDRARLADSMAESARDLTVWEGEYRTQVPGRPTIWLQGRSQPERLPDGSTLWHGFMTDISARKASEQLLRERDAALAGARPLGGMPPQTLAFAAGDRVQAVEADRALDGLDRHIHQLGARARERDQPPAIAIGRRRPARGEDIGLGDVEMDRLGFDQNAGCGFRDLVLGHGDSRKCCRAFHIAWHRAWRDGVFAPVKFSVARPEMPVPPGRKCPGHVA